MERCWLDGSIKIKEIVFNANILLEGTVARLLNYDDTDYCYN